jgi:hypothetical protein
MERISRLKLEPGASHVHKQLEIATFLAFGILLVRIGEHISKDLNQISVSTPSDASR